MRTEVIMNFGKMEVFGDLLRTISVKWIRN